MGRDSRRLAGRRLPAGLPATAPTCTPMSHRWSPCSWREKPIGQNVAYPDPAALEAVLEALSELPPLVTSWEVENLKRQLAEASRGERFLLQGGDCCESFSNCRSDVIASKLKILLKMSVVLTYGSHRRVIRMGRFAGQYAKPRSADTETRDGVTLPCFRGNLINRREFTAEARVANPQFLLRGYERAALTLNFIRGLIDGGFADMRHPELWDLDFVKHSAQSNDYRELMRALGESVTFMETMAGHRFGELDRVEFFTSHEGLHLAYEQAQTRHVPRRTGWYNLSTHFPWIGDRTRDLGGAHVEFFRGIANPIGVKVGPSCSPDELVALCGILNPENEPGRLTVIHRFGAGRVEERLPPLVEAVERAGAEVLWCCDPMHGNTITTPGGVKTRDFDEILGELTQAFSVHHRLGTRLGGVHFELTGEDVTECLGGARGLGEADLGRAYHSDVDPRLNYEQSLEMAMLIARQMSLQNGHRTV
ncbi:MAG: class II 3-deoxy-7-phosphoheptulonate synthase [Thermoguttaceae bacterium]